METPREGGGTPSYEFKIRIRYVTPKGMVF